MRPLVRRLLRAALVAAPASLAAQISTVDEGSFTITRDGARVGREEFRIVRQPVAGGVEYVARGLGAYGDRRISSALQTDATGAPLRYQVDVKNGPDTESRLTGQMMRGRFSAQIRTGRGEAASEFAATDGTILVDDELFHQYYFLPLGNRLGAAGEVPVLAPRRTVQAPVRVSPGGAESVAVGGQTIAATRYTLAVPGGPERTVWLDAGGHVLKVAVPAQHLVALRDDPPSR